MRIVACRTSGTGRRDLIGAWHRPNSVLSTDRSRVHPWKEETSDMVTLGVDAHKRTHTIVAVDETGRALAERTLAATTAGHLDALRWAEQWPSRRWALEDCAHLTRRLTADLLAAGEAVVRVPP